MTNHDWMTTGCHFVMPERKDNSELAIYSIYKNREKDEMVVLIRYRNALFLRLVGAMPQPHRAQNGAMPRRSAIRRGERR